jgi:hypothetical protein
VISILRFEVADEAAFVPLVEAALGALAARPGYLRGRAARSTDEPDQWVLLTEWLDVGSYRRALGSYDVKVNATPLLSVVMDQPSGFEELIEQPPGGDAIRRPSDLLASRGPAGPAS